MEWEVVVWDRMGVTDAGVDTGKVLSFEPSHSRKCRLGTGKPLFGDKVEPCRLPPPRWGCMPIWEHLQPPLRIPLLVAKFKGSY